MFTTEEKAKAWITDQQLFKGVSLHVTPVTVDPEPEFVTYTVRLRSVSTVDIPVRMPRGSSMKETYETAKRLAPSIDTPNWLAEYARKV